MQARSDNHLESKPQLPKFYLSGEKKIFIVLGLLSLLIITGAVILLSKGSSTKTSVPEDQIVAKNGLHWHPRLEIYIKGKKQEISANIGIGAIHQRIHTHEDNKEGILHMEMAGLVTKDETELGNFFRIWGKEFSSTKILDSDATEEGKVKMTVNGKANTEFASYHMRDGDKIEIRYD